MTDELTITKFVFDDWWTDTYGYRIKGLLTQEEIEALIDFHWGELQATAIRHSLRELKEETKEDYVDVKEVCQDYNPGCTCGDGGEPWFHMKSCPVYQPR